MSEIVTARVVATSLDELLAGVTSREPLKNTDSKSGAALERVVIDGTSYVVKHFAERDWLADSSHDDSCRAVGLFEDGVYAAVAEIVDATVVGAARLAGPGRWPAALLMRDAAADFIPLDAAVDLDTHAAFIDAMSALHARFWEAPPATTYMSLAGSYDMLSPRRARLERESFGDRSDVLRAVPVGWARVADEAPEAWRAVAGLLDEPAPMVAAMLRAPRTFLQGDWKMGNLGRRADGRVVLVDWDRPTIGPAVYDLAWYLSVNCDRITESKDDTIARYRRGLHGRGVVTDGWWDEQLALALLGSFLQLGWSKAGQPDELGWWAERAVDAAARL